MNKIYIKSAPKNIVRATDILSQYFADVFVSSNAGAISVTVQNSASENTTVNFDGNTAAIEGGNITRQLRALGELIAGNIAPNGDTRTIKSSFNTIGIMLDSSRNGVMKPEHFKKWICALAMMGMNQIMLYTEDTYEILGHERFGYLRGKYTQEELKDLDAFSKNFGLEIVGCIQTLGHLEQIARWETYRESFDFGSTILVGDEKTYALIDDMISAIKGSLTSSKIHIGMDEAWQLGRGKYLDLHGDRSHFDIFNEHLERVVEICENHGLKPMIWSDMYFAIASKKHEYYDSEATIPDSVAEKIPAGADLVYWDYYHDDEEFYLDYIAKHRKLGHEPIMASGVWTWGQLWYNRKVTETNVTACMNACLKAEVKDLFFTMWGDDGAYCEYDSSLAGLTFAAEKAYNDEAKPEYLSNMFKIFANGEDYYADNLCVSDALTCHAMPPAALLWDDPILGIARNEVLGEDVEIYEGIKVRLKELIEKYNSKTFTTTAGGDFEFALSTAKLLLRKMNLRDKFVAAYDNRDIDGLKAVVMEALMLADFADQTEAVWRRSWMRRNKPEGYEVLQIRLATIARRLRETATRIEEFIEGETSCIPELENRPTRKERFYNLWHEVSAGTTTI